MYNVLDIGRSGLNAMQYNLDLTSNDIANSNTYGYKRKQVSFNELLINQISDREVLLSANANNPGINAGTKSVTGKVDFAQGTIEPTNNKFNMAIMGEGFFGVRNSAGELLLTRDGDFYMDSEKNIVNSDGYHVDMDIYLPRANWERDSISIKANGEIQDMNTHQVLARVNLYRPENLDDLYTISDSSYINTDGILYNSQNNPEMFGDIAASALERSNVDLSDSMVDLITSQRAYALNSRVVQTTDDMLGAINGMKR